MSVIVRAGGSLPEGQGGRQVKYYVCVCVLCCTVLFVLFTVPHFAVAWVREVLGGRLERVRDPALQAAAAAVAQLLQPGRAWGAMPAPVMRRRSRQPAKDQLQPLMPYLDELADALQLVGVAYKAVEAFLSANPAAAGPHTIKSVLWHTFVAPVADAIDAALLLMKPLLQIKGPLPHDHAMSLLTTLWSLNKAGEWGQAG